MDILYHYCSTASFHAVVQSHAGSAFETNSEVDTPFLQLFFLKSSAFREEREWRVLSYLTTDGEDDCLHRVVDNRIVPYLKVELVELERSPIVEVILGPKHGITTEDSRKFLEDESLWACEDTAV